MKKILFACLLVLAGGVLIASVLEQRNGTSGAADAGSLADPFLDPYAYTMAHDHSGMSTEETPEEKAISMEASWPEGTPAAGEAARLVLRIADGEGRPVRDFAAVHERKLHLIAVSANLEHFQHVHPEPEGDGRFVLQVTFPTGGEYKLFADFQPSGMNQLARSAIVRVAGEPQRESKLRPASPLTAETNGLRIEAAFGSRPMAGMQTELSFTFTDAADGTPIRDLEPYLGAVGHVVIVDEALDVFIHVHPLNWASSGPQAVFGATFPKEGTYKMWGQFQRNGERIVVPFAFVV